MGRGKGSNKYLATPEEITKLKTEIQAYISQGYSKTRAISQIAADYYCGEATIWDRIRGD